MEQNQPYLCLLYQTLFSTAYYGLFRVGELTKGSHPVLARDVHMGKNKNKVLFVLRTSKTHGFDERPQTVKISSTRSVKKEIKLWCPFDLLRRYIDQRGKFRQVNEPFFVIKGNIPVSPVNARKVLKETIEHARMESKYYDFHGFRAGMASDLYFKHNISVDCLKKLGRWKSNIVYSYLKW